MMCCSSIFSLRSSSQNRSLASWAMTSFSALLRSTQPHQDELFELCLCRDQFYRGSESFSLESAHSSGQCMPRLVSLPQPHLSSYFHSRRGFAPPDASLAASGLCFCSGELARDHSRALLPIDARRELSCSLHRHWGQRGDANTIPYRTGAQAHTRARRDRPLFDEIYDTIRLSTLLPIGVVRLKQADRSLCCRDQTSLSAAINASGSTRAVPFPSAGNRRARSILSHCRCCCHFRSARRARPGYQVNSGNAQTNSANAPREA